MSGMCCGMNVGETQTTAPVEPTTKSARRRRMEIHQFNFSPVDLSEDGAGRRRKKLKVDAVVKDEEKPKENIGELSEEKKRETKKSFRDLSDLRWGSSRGLKPELPKFGLTSICGRRRDMEDAVAIHPYFCGRNRDSPSGWHFFGVYDGHGCSHVATRCRDRMHEIVGEEIEKGESSSFSWEQTMVQSFSKMDFEAGSRNTVASPCRCELRTPQCDAVGSTAVVALLTPDKIVVSNCGDSRAVLCRNGVAVPLSVDHKPDRPDELNRIQEAGGRVIFWDGPRVLGMLAMSRAIGDNYLKPYVIPVPEVTVTERTAEDECLILASDGLWDVVSNETACGVARMCLMSHKRPENDIGDSSDEACSDASVLLTKLALARGSTDNVTVLVIDLWRR
ncbi:protein phosphatase 2C [Striga asiatica]|uniref:protein-serine/threonine phosphatase n=1 Tax=Striga asiatica TaxID=4170 RepID=A0A5A7RBJ3_STRAF|nr:protein phosphatase 2C [Striga asiatica]